MSGFVALDVSQVKNAAIAGSVVPVIIGLLLFKFLASMITRAIVLVIALALGALIFFQRQEISDCVDNARANLEAVESGSTVKIECNILGFDVSLKP